MRNRSGYHDSSEEEEEKGIEKYTKLHYVQYWYCFCEEHPNLFQAMKGGLSDDVFNQTGVDVSFTEVAPSYTKKRKSPDLEHVMNLYAESQERTLAFKEETLEYLKSAATAKANAATAMANASNAQANAARIQTILAMTKESELLFQKCKDLKKVFVKQCNENPNLEKRDHKARMKGHRARVAAREAAREAGGLINPNSDSEDSQASLLIEVDEVEAKLRKAMKELRNAEEVAGTS